MERWGGSYFMVLNTRFQRSHAESWYRENEAIRNLLFSKLRAQTNYSLTFSRKEKKKKKISQHTWLQARDRTVGSQPSSQAAEVTRFPVPATHEGGLQPVRMGGITPLAFEVQKKSAHQNQWQTNSSSFSSKGCFLLPDLNLFTWFRGHVFLSFGSSFFRRVSYGNVEP